jgi:hypothetical protein
VACVTPYQVAGIKMASPQPSSMSGIVKVAGGVDTDNVSPTYDASRVWMIIPF